MPRSKYQRMSKLDIIYLLQEGIYRCNIDTGEVFDRNGKPLKSRPNNIHESSDGSGHIAIELFYTFPPEMGGKRVRINIGVHQLIWMAATMTPIPRDWEIHHLDEDVTNNAFSNLLCLHKLDHKKFHYEPSNDVPF